ncbi:MAG: hypothetical protein JWP14_3303 [Frankiales bacterium]|nr:hypothetical protein [Frankiales bacterium]
MTPDVQRLVDRRAQARAAKDYAASDALRDELAALGWLVRDSADGQVVTAAPPYPVLRTVRDLPENAGTAVVGLLVEGWPDDVGTCVAALLEHTEVGIVLLENGPTDAGAVVHELAQDRRVEELHVEQPAGWAEAHNALVRHSTAPVHVLMDLSTVLEGDAITPLVEALTTFDAAGWRGVCVDDGWLSFSDAPAGEVEALLGYLVAVRRQVALDVPLPPKARFYRNADLEWSFLLRERGHRLVAVDVPVRQDRHRGYHDSDPAYRERESKKTYDRFLQRFRGREELRLT